MRDKHFIDDDVLFEDSDDEVIESSKESKIIETPTAKNEQLETKQLNVVEPTPKEIPKEVYKKELEEKVETIKHQEPKKNQSEVSNSNSETRVSKPLLQIKELDDNPYSDRYKRTKPQNKTKDKKKQKYPNSQNNVTSKKLISISQKNIEVLSILKNLDKKYDSESDFICRAIIEKYERDNENNKEVDIKSLVKNALDELVEEKFIILKGSSDISINNNSSNISDKAYVEQNSINKAIEEKNQEENKGLLLGILGALEDDDF